MNGTSITIQLSPQLYKRMSQLAAVSAEPIESAIVRQLEALAGDMLPQLAPDETAELQALHYLSDEALWTIAREQMALERQDRMQVLMTHNDQGQLSEDERTELTQLVELGQRLMLRKAKAMALLADRGYSIRRMLL